MNARRGRAAPSRNGGSGGGTGLPTPLSDRYEIGQDDLPLHCPLENMTLWNSHPRVYLPIEDTGQERCPYCGTLYVLKRDAVPAP